MRIFSRQVGEPGIHRWPPVVFPAAMNQCMIPRLDVAEKPQRSLPNMPTDNPDVLFAVVPFAMVSEPVLPVSILKAVATNAGFSTAVRYFSFDFAERIGPELYNQITIAWGARPLIGDWIFAESLYGNRLPSPRRYWAHLRKYYFASEEELPKGRRRKLVMPTAEYLAEHVWPGVLEARKLAPEFVERWADEIQAMGPRVVAFTSTCIQACSCLAVARRLKKNPRPPVIIVGGPSCHMELGWNWLRCFPWIDYVCTGEGEDVFPLFLRKVLCQGQTEPIPGILGRHDRRLSVPPPLRDLDQSPVPDHSDYFEQLARSHLPSKGVLPDLPLESSRGCWWGEKCQCVFCGDPPNGLAYRSKSASRVLVEIRGFEKKYRFGHFHGVDEVLDKRHIGAVFGKLGRSRSRPPIAYQVRADLTRNELRTLYAGGVKHLAPGIESLSNAMLRLMRKGPLPSATFNCSAGVRKSDCGRGGTSSWGFPGEPVSEYERMTKLLPLLTHLRPPADVVPLALTRFSPHRFNAQQFGLTDLRPWPSYAFAYPFDQRKLEGIAYHFIFRYADGRRPSEYTGRLRRQVDGWANLWQTPDGSHPSLDKWVIGNDVVITDTRRCAVRRTHRLRGLEARIYQQCDAVQSLSTLLRVFHGHASDADLTETLRRLVADKLMVEDEGKYLSLAVNQKARGRQRVLSAA